MALGILRLPQHSGSFVRENGGWRLYHQWLEEQGIAKFNGLRLVTLPRRSKEKTGRNDPCPCGSGKKYKKCCMGKD